MSFGASVDIFCNVVVNLLSQVIFVFGYVSVC